MFSIQIGFFLVIRLFICKTTDTWCNFVAYLFCERKFYDLRNKKRAFQRCTQAI